MVDRERFGTSLRIDTGSLDGFGRHQLGKGVAQGLAPLTERRGDDAREGRGFDRRHLGGRDRLHPHDARRHLRRRPEGAA